MNARPGAPVAIAAAAARVRRSAPARSARPCPTSSRGLAGAIAGRDSNGSEKATLRKPRR